MPFEPISSRHQPMLVVFIAAIVGTVLDRWLAIPFVAWWLCAMGAMCGGLMFVRRPPQLARRVLAIIAITTLSGLWHHWHWHRFSEHDLGFRATSMNQPSG